jgi:hypothetical protein
MSELQLFRTSAKFLQSAFLAILYHAFSDAPHSPCLAIASRIAFRLTIRMQNLRIMRSLCQRPQVLPPHQKPRHHPPRRRRPSLAQALRPRLPDPPTPAPKSPANPARSRCHRTPHCHFERSRPTLFFSISLPVKWSVCAERTSSANCRTVLFPSPHLPKIPIRADQSGCVAKTTSTISAANRHRSRSSSSRWTLAASYPSPALGLICVGLYSK